MRHGTDIAICIYDATPHGMNPAICNRGARGAFGLRWHGFCCPPLLEYIKFNINPLPISEEYIGIGKEGGLGLRRLIGAGVEVCQKWLESGLFNRLTFRSVGVRLYAWLKEGFV